MNRKHSSYWRYKVIRDPLYGFIGLTEREVKLINTNWFIRLLRIKQLSHTYLVYPGAMHTRYEHSLGALYVADKIALQLDLNDYEREIVRAAALLHDIGQGPFSHLFDEVLSWINKDCNHEYLTKLIIERDEEIKSILKGESGNEEDIYKDVLEIIDTERRGYKNILLLDIISSGIDCDKLDYLRRDSYHAGVAYGIFDIERVLNTITKDNKNRLCISMKGKDALESYRLGRYLMYLQVYHHHTREIADSMFLRAINLAINDENLFEDNVTLSDKLNYRKNKLKNMLNFYKTLDDYSIYNILKRSSTPAKKLIKMLEQRTLLKRAVNLDLTSGRDVPDPLDRKMLVDMTEEEMESLSKEIAKKINEPPEYVIVKRCEISMKLYEEYEILVYDENKRKTYDLYELSPFNVKKDSLIKMYVFSRPNKRKDAYNAFKKITGIKIS